MNTENLRSWARSLLAAVASSFITVKVLPLLPPWLASLVDPTIVATIGAVVAALPSMVWSYFANRPGSLAQRAERVLADHPEVADQLVAALAEARARAAQPK